MNIILMFRALSIIFSLSFSLIVFSLHLTSPSGFLVDLRGVLMYFWWLFSLCYLKKIDLIIETKRKTEFLKKDHLALELTEEFPKLDNRMLMNASLWLLYLKYMSQFDGIFVGIMFSLFVLLAHYLICFSEIDMWKYGDRKQGGWLSLHRI